MTDDSDNQVDRYPQPGERLWDWRRGWVTVIPAYGPRERAADERGLRILGEVAVMVEDTDERAIVKLTNLAKGPDDE